MQSNSEDLHAEMAYNPNGKFEELLSYPVQIDSKIYKVKIWDRSRIGIDEVTNG